jgi:hypothetical protein
MDGHELKVHVYQPIIHLSIVRGGKPEDGAPCLKDPQRPFIDFGRRKVQVIRKDRSRMDNGPEWNIPPCVEKDLEVRHSKGAVR